MNREQMVEAVADLVRVAITASEETECEYDFYEADYATLILNAVLPQVSTVAELEALPNYSLVVGKDGPYMVRHIGGVYLQQKFGNGWDCNPEDVLEGGSLTVVWQPEG